MLGGGVVWWSLATALTPLAAQLGLPVLLAARAAMGVGEGVAMPAMNNLLSRWVPVQERSRSLALVYSGMYTGSVLGLALSPHMIHAMQVGGARFFFFLFRVFCFSSFFDPPPPPQWPSVFYIFGALGVVWYLFWEARAASSPSEDAACTPAEKAYIAASAVGPAPAQAIPWRQLLSRAPVWALIVCHFCHNWGTFILLTWMPTYYNQAGRRGGGGGAGAGGGCGRARRRRGRADPRPPRARALSRSSAWTSWPRAPTPSCPGSPWSSPPTRPGGWRTPRSRGGRA